MWPDGVGRRSWVKRERLRDACAMCATVARLPVKRVLKLPVDDLFNEAGLLKVPCTLLVSQPYMPHLGRQLYRACTLASLCALRIGLRLCTRCFLGGVHVFI